MFRAISQVIRKQRLLSFKEISSVSYVPSRGRRKRSIPKDFFATLPPNMKTSQLDDLNLNDLVPQYRNFENLNNADGDLRKVLSLEHASNAELLEAKLQQYAKKLQKHKYDYSSPEMKVAYLTVLIRGIQEHYVKSGYQHKNKRLYLEKLVERRKNILLELRKQRFERYALVMEVLDLKITFDPEFNVELTKRAARISEMRLRAFAEVQHKKYEHLRRVDELEKVKAKLREKVQSVDDLENMLL